MHRVVIIDDEKGASENLCNILNSFFDDVEVIKVYNDSIAASKELPLLSFDILFLDVKMPGMNGFELLTQLGKRNFHVIFVTAFDNYALKAIKANALDYLLKPINTLDLKQGIAKVDDLKELVQLQLEESEKYNTSIKNFYKTYDGKEDYQTSITIRGIDRILITKIADIIYIKATNYGAMFTLTDGTKIISDLTLNDCEEVLNPSLFMRCHMSFIVNKKQINEVKAKRTGTIYLKNNEVIPISARKKTKVLEFIK
ncbi:response regulator [bacterium]|nr:response regulator [bacterium]